MKTLTLTPVISEKLAKLANPPSSLRYRGEEIEALLERPVVAVVGTRKASPYGRRVTEDIVDGLARAGVVIISGLALGIDSIAHSAAVKAKGNTIAVLPSGLNAVYPASHEPLSRQIVQHGGGLLSEYSDNHRPRKAEFLERNRLIAALADAVIVTEAAERSGSLNTARHAAEMDIPLFAVPGNITSHLSSGTNNLLMNGAQVLTDVQQVLNVLSIKLDTSDSYDHKLEGKEKEVYEAIAGGHTILDTIHVQTSISVAELQTILTMLELQGVVSQNTVGEWSL